MSMKRHILTQGILAAMTIEQRETVQPVEQPANLLLEDEDRPMVYECKFCGLPTFRSPEEQDVPEFLCWPEDHL